MSHTKPSILSVAEVVINVNDILQAREFYESVLGFSLHSQYPENNPTIVFLTIAEVDSPLGHNGHPQIFALIDPRRHGPAKKRFTGIDIGQSSLNHVAFEIEPSQYQAERDRLRELGLKVQEEVFPHMNAKAIFFRDPDGNTLEFICHDGSAT